jgi:hypothetical protein
MHLRLILVVVALLCGCMREVPGDQSPNPLEAVPVDASRITEVDEVASWGYRREASADLDGDGRTELVVLTSDVELSTAGVPLWEDGHRWAVYVQGSARERTLLYGAFVPNGFVEAAISNSDDKGRRRVLVQERTPHQMRAFEVEYAGPGVVRASSSAYYQIEQWLPGSASLH